MTAETIRDETRTGEPSLRPGAMRRGKKVVGLVLIVICLCGIVHYLVLDALFSGEPLHVLKGPEAGAVSGVRPAVEQTAADRSREIIRFSVFFWTLSGLITVGVLSLLLNRLLLRPLARIERRIIEAVQDNLSSPSGFTGTRDEVASLSHRVTAMIQGLNEANRRLLRQSSRVGLARMGARILHNVRNELTPVIGDVEASVERLANLPLTNTERALRELEDGNAGAARTEDLQRFLQISAGVFVDAVRDAEYRLGRITAAIARTEDVLGKFNALQRAPFSSETYGVDKALSLAVSFVPRRFREHERIRFVGDPALKDLAPLRGDRIAVVQVLTELLTRSALAVEASPGKSGDIRITGAMEDDAGRRILRLTVEDSADYGLASDPAGLFTRRKEESALPRQMEPELHECADLMSALGGTIVAERSSKTTGLAVHLTVPLTP